MMYKIISKVIGEISVNGKKMSYNSFVMVNEITDKITELQQNQLVKVEIIGKIEPQIVEKVQTKKNNKIKENKENKD